ncbi:MAG: terminase family protein [Candidatus Cloacimonas sp.]
MDEVTKRLRWMRENKPKDFAKALMQLPQNELQSILYDWNIWGRDKQLAPEGDWRYWVVLGGRSSGKSRTGSEWIIQRAREGKGPIGLIGQTSADVRDVMIEILPSSIIQVSPPDFKPVYEPSKRRLVWPNGTFAIAIGGDNAETQLRGPQFQTVWCDELPKFIDPSSTLEQIKYSLRIGDSRALFSTTPTPHEVIKNFWKEWKKNPDGDVRLVVMPTQDNAANVDKKFLEDIEKSKGSIMYRQEVLGEIIWDSDYAYFKQEDIEKYRINPDDQPEEYKRIIVAVDPAVTSGKNSDLTGIIVAALGYDNEMYVLADRTMKGTPEQWASTVGELFRFYNADSVIAERNQGGDMVESTIRSFGGNLPVKLVTATRGKLIRAEPISLLFSQGRIHMVGHFPDLEQQMTSYDGSQKKSPDNYDAFVWAGHELMLGKQNKVTSTEILL